VSTAYAISQDMIDRFGEPELVQLTDRSNTGAIDQTVLQRALDDAGDELDTYIGSRYQLPLASVPPVLTRVACDVARYRLFDDQAPQEVRTRYADAVTLLTRIAGGQLSLGLPTATPEAASDLPQVNAPGRTLTTDSLADYQPGLTEFEG
jgi:phage gp36-like protein